VRKEGKRLEKVFPTKKQASGWEVKMLRKPVNEWNVKTATACLNDWAQAYMDVAKARFLLTSYREKRSMFKRFFKEISPALPVASLKAGDVMGYIVKQIEERSGYAANKERKTWWRPGTGA
jgi:hypothetical protein